MFTSHGVFVGLLSMFLGPTMKIMRVIKRINLQYHRMYCKLISSNSRNIGEEMMEYQAGKRKERKGER